MTKLQAKTKRYKNHLAIALIVEGKSIGWIQLEKDNFAYYSAFLNCEVIDHKSMVYVKFPKQKEALPF